MGDRAAEARARAETLIDSWNREGLEAMAERLWAPDIIWEEPDRFPDAGVHRGRDACIRRMRERFALLGEVRLELVTAEPAGDDLFIEALIHGQGTASGAPTTMREFFISEIADGRTTRLREFLDRETARAAIAGD